MRTVQAIDFPEDAYIKDAAALAQSIKAARTQSGLRLEDVAGLVNLSRQTMVNIEAGRGGVSIDNVLKVAHAVGVSLFAVASEKRTSVSNLLLDLQYRKNSKK